MDTLEKIQNESFSADGDLQLKYDDFKKKNPTSTISFADWKKQYYTGQIKKGTEIGKAVLDTLKGVFSKGKEITPAPEQKSGSKKFIGMPQGVAVFIGITAVVGIGFLIYAIVK